MPKLSELKTKQLIKALVYGHPGTGKTCFAAGFPGPIRYLDFDGKINSAARFYEKEPQRLEQIDYENLNAALGTDPLAQFKKETDALVAQQKSGQYKYKTLVIDSVTTFSSACLQHIINTNLGIKAMQGVQCAQGMGASQAHYGVLLREFIRLIPGLLTLDMNVVMLGHLSEYIDEKTGIRKREVMCDGSFSEKIPIYFDEVYYSEKDDKGQHWLVTKGDGSLKLRTSIPRMPDRVPMKYEELVKVR